MKNTGLRVRQWICFLLAVCCMLTIFFFSAQNGTSSDGMSMPIADWLRQNLHLPLTDVQANHFVRKAAHFLIYLLLAVFASGWTSGFHWSAAAWLPVTVAFCALYAASDEFHQSFTAQRSPALQDVLLDTFGALTGALLVLLLLHIFHHFHNRRGGASMICPNCGYDNADDVICCIKCGEPLVDNKALFPPEDDEKVDLSEPDVYEPYEEEEVPEQKSKAPLVILIIFLCLVAVAAGLSIAWHQERGVWPWQQLFSNTASSQEGESSSHTPILPQKTVQTYTAADLAAAVQKSGFQAFAVAESEISGIKVDTQTLEDSAIVQFTVTKAMAILHMQIRFPMANPASSAVSGDAAASSAVKEENPVVTSWGVDTWKLTGTWNDAGGNALIIETCSAGNMTAYYIPAGSTDSRQISGSISETCEISLLSSKTQISGQFSPNGTGLLSVTLDGSKAQTQQFVMLSTAMASIPSAPSATPSLPPVSSAVSSSAVSAQTSVSSVASQQSAVPSQAVSVVP